MCSGDVTGEAVTSPSYLSTAILNISVYRLRYTVHVGSFLSSYRIGFVSPTEQKTLGFLLPILAD
jgi:hypothetical protein